jgi:hypothetical protein
MAAMGLALTCVAFLVTRSPETSAFMAQKWASMSIVGHSQTLAAWKASRTSFLEETAKTYPADMAKAMNFSADPWLVSRSAL